MEVINFKYQICSLRISSDNWIQILHSMTFFTFRVTILYNSRFFSFFLTLPFTFGIYQQRTISFCTPPSFCSNFNLLWSIKGWCVNSYIATRLIYQRRNVTDIVKYIYCSSGCCVYREFYWSVCITNQSRSLAIYNRKKWGK